MKFINNPFFTKKAFKSILLAFAAALLFVSCTGNVNDLTKMYLRQRCELVHRSVYVIFQEGNVMGESEKKPVILKSFNFKPVN